MKVPVSYVHDSFSEQDIATFAKSWGCTREETIEHLRTVLVDQSC